MGSMNLWKRAFLAAATLLIAGLAASVARADSEARPITVVFRCDDFSATTDTKVDFAIIDAFRQRHIPLTLAVVPFRNDKPISQDKLDDLRKAVEDGTVDVAQHGTTHLEMTKPPWRRFGSEFEGLDEARQEAAIARGKAFLESGLHARMTVFVPPFNNYDENTVRALDKLGFLCLSAGTSGPALEGSPIKLLPSTCQIVDIEAVVAVARSQRQGKPAIIVALFHNQQYGEAAGDGGVLSLDALRRTLDWVVSQGDVRVLSVSQVCSEPVDLGAGRLTANRGGSVFEGMPPSFLRKTNPAQVYLDPSIAPSLRHRWIAIVAGFFVILAATFGAAACLVGLRVLRTSRWARIAALVVPLLLLAALAAWGCHTLIWGFRLAGSMCAILGIWIGMLTCIIVLKRRGA